MVGKFSIPIFVAGKAGGGWYVVRIGRKVQTSQYQHGGIPAAKINWRDCKNFILEDNIGIFGWVGRWIVGGWDLGWFFGGFARLGLGGLEFL